MWYHFIRQAVGHRKLKLKGVMIMRVIKDAKERKNEILDAANKLFALKGFDGTSTNDILEMVGIARGTLYYHFKSKEDIMDALIERYNTQILTKAQKISEDKSIPIIERIVRVIMSLKMDDENNGEIMNHIHKPQNALMHQKIQKLVISKVPPILESIIQEGIEEGLFNTPFPYETIEMIVIYTNTVFDNDIISITETQQATRLQALILNMERLFAAEEGSLKYILKAFGEEN